MTDKKAKDLENKRLSVDVPKELHKHLKLLSLEKDTTVRDLVVRALELQYQSLFTKKHISQDISEKVGVACVETE